MVDISPNSLLWGSLLEKKAGRDMLWGHPRSLSALCLSPFRLRLQTLSAMCPPCDRHVSALCLPRVRFESALAASPDLVRHVLAMCPPSVHRVTTMCLPCIRSLPTVVHYVTMCPPFVGAGPPCVRSGLGLPFGLCPLLACCGAGQWHHQTKFFLTIAQPTAFILYCMPVGQFPWHSFWLPKFGLCKRTLCLKNCLGSKSMPVYFFWGRVCISELEPTGAVSSQKLVLSFGEV